MNNNFTKITKNNNNYCNNCGKQGHIFHQCKLPITSYGIILFRYHNLTLQFLMIRRKDSFGFIDFVRGKYNPYNIQQIQNSINEMANNEKERLYDETFESLWKNMWGDKSIHPYKNEELISHKKYETIKNGIIVNEEQHICLSDLLKKSDTNWKETEWEFPKGRRNYQEKDLDCALREFKEETGIDYAKIHIIENVIPFEEIFVGSNHKTYKNKYFVAFLNDINTDDKNDNTLLYFQKTEVSKIEWKSYEECINSIRPYNLEKKRLVENVFNMLNTYKYLPFTM
jgi:8-oxo-dGTP pyrophosphatase MutT (NUDIX family)